MVNDCYMNAAINKTTLTGHDLVAAIPLATFGVLEFTTYAALSRVQSGARTR